MDTNTPSNDEAFKLAGHLIDIRLKMIEFVREHDLTLEEQVAIGMNAFEAVHAAANSAPVEEGFVSNSKKRG